MKRSFLLCVFIFFLAPVALVAQTSDLTLKNVSVDTLFVPVDTVFTQQIKLNWQLNSLADSVTIYRCTHQCNLENNYIVIDKVKMENTDLEWIDENANPLSLYYYSIGWKLSGKTAPQTNMALQATSAINGCLNATSLIWNPYINMMDTIDYYNILYRKKGIETEFTSLDSVKGTHYAGYYYQPSNKITYLAQYLDNNTVYEFVIQAVSKNKAITAFSNITEFETQFESEDPVAINISKVSVIDDKYFEIEVNTDDFPKPFQQMYLYKDGPYKDKKDNVFNFIRIDSTNYDQKNSYSFTDTVVDPHSGLYFYQTIAYHSCKVQDNSDTMSNIWLTGERMDKYHDSIRFYRIGFSDIDPTEQYELYRIVKDKNITITNNLTIKNNRYLVDVEPFLKDGVVLMYQVKSEKNCLSNTLIIEHEPHIKFPNAFSPLSLRPEDATFYPILLFPSEQDYLFIIYDRWGKEVFRTDTPPVYGDYGDPQGRWDGKDLQGRECPYGIYSFRISYRYNEGTRRYSETGSVLLIR